jgi:hypothetical protein
MIVDDFDIFRSFIGPSKADPPLIAYANRMLCLPVACERLRAIAGRGAQILGEGPHKLTIPVETPRRAAD